LLLIELYLFLREYFTSSENFIYFCANILRQLRTLFIFDANILRQLRTSIIFARIFVN